MSCFGKRLSGTRTCQAHLACHFSRWNARLETCIGGSYPSSEGSSGGAAWRVWYGGASSRCRVGWDVNFQLASKVITTILRYFLRSLPSIPLAIGDLLISMSTFVGERAAQVGEVFNCLEVVSLHCDVRLLADWVMTSAFVILMVTPKSYAGDIQSTSDCISHWRLAFGAQSSASSRFELWLLPVTFVD